MGEKPTDVPDLDELDDDADLPAYWAEKTTITIRRATKESLDRHRDGRPWDVYLMKLRREHADPLTLTDADQIADAVVNEIGGGQDAGEVALAIADYLMTDYGLPERVAGELEGRMR